MSRNLELLRKIGVDQDLFRTAEAGAPVSDNIVPPPDWDGVGETTAAAPVESFTTPSFAMPPPPAEPAPFVVQGFEAAAPAEAAADVSTFEFTWRPTGNGVAREEILKLIQRVFLVPKDQAPAAVVFSGVGEEDGCARICARAAEALAGQTKGAVCVIDAALQAPRLHQYFGAENVRGLANFLLLAGPPRMYAQKLAGGNLWVMPSGSVAGSPAELLSVDRLKARLADLRRDFAHVLISAPPVNQFAESILLGQLCDGFVLVVQAHATRRDVARRVKENLEGANVKLLGAVLDHRTFPIPESIYRRI